MEDSSESKESPTNSAGAAVLEKPAAPAAQPENPSFFSSVWKTITGGGEKGPPPPPTASGPAPEGEENKNTADATGIFSKN